MAHKKQRRFLVHLRSMLLPGGGTSDVSDNESTGRAENEQSKGSDGTNTGGEIPHFSKTEKRRLEKLWTDVIKPRQKEVGNQIFIKFLQHEKARQTFPFGHIEDEAELINNAQFQAHTDAVMSIVNMAFSNLQTPWLMRPVLHELGGSHGQRSGFDGYLLDKLMDVMVEVLCCSDQKAGFSQQTYIPVRMLVGYLGNEIRQGWLDKLGHTPRGSLADQGPDNGLPKQGEQKGKPDSIDRPTTIDGKTENKDTADIEPS